MSYSHHTFKLENQISGIAVRVPCAKTSTLIIASKVGSKDEKKGEFGIAHLLEHLIFRGSSQVKSSIELTHKMDQLGAVFNAYVSKHVTYYHVKFYWNDKNFKELVEIMVNLVTEPELKNKSLELEKKVVLNEIDQYLNDDEEYVDKLLTQSILGDDPLAHDITGDKKIIQKITQSEIKKFHQKHYQSNNLYAVLAGKYSVEGLRLFKKILSQIKSSDTPKEKEKKKVAIPKEIPVKNDRTLELLVRTRNDNNQTVLGIGFPTIGFLDPRKEEMIMLNSLIAGSDGSKLHLSLREEKGLVYSVSSNYYRYPEGGLLIIKTSFQPSKLREVLSLIYEVIEGLKKDISEKDQRQHLESLIGYNWIEAESIFHLAEYYAQELIFCDEIRPYHYQAKSLTKIKNKNLVKLSNSVLDWNKASIIAIGPVKKGDLVKALPKELK